MESRSGRFYQKNNYCILRNWEIVERIPFYLKRRVGWQRCLKREAELENHPVIKDIYEKCLDNWKHQFLIYKFLRKNFPAILKQNEMDYICMMIFGNYGFNGL